MVSKKGVIPMANNVIQFPGAGGGSGRVRSCVSGAGVRPFVPGAGASDDARPTVSKGEAPAAGRFSTPGVYQVKATLCYCEPAIWRRFLIPADDSCAQLADALLVAFDWSGELVFYFRKDALFLDDPDLERKHAHIPRLKGERHIGAREKRIDEVLKPGESMSFFYDMEDYWEIKVEVERHIPDEEAPYPFMPVALGGARFSPPEGVGGAIGYTDFCYAMAHPDDPLHAEAQDWYDLLPEGRFDPERFDIFEMNGLFALELIDSHEAELLPEDEADVREMCKLLLAEKLSSAACMTTDFMAGVYGVSPSSSEK